MSSLLRVTLLLAVIIPAALHAAFELQNLGSGSFIVAPEATTASYAQTDNALRFNGSYGLGDTLGGVFSGDPQDWTSYGSFGLRMAVTGDNLALPFTIEFYDASFSVINSYQANTIGLGVRPQVVHLELSRSGTTNFAQVAGLQFTWDNAGTVDTSLTEVVGFTPGSFVARAPGGVRFLSSTNETAGVELAPDDSSWRTLSDSNAKTDITAVNHQATLQKLAELPVTSWSYRHDDSRQHIGPMAQDFHATLGLGPEETHITTLDFDGVALSALKGLIAELQECQRRSTAQAKRLTELEASIVAMQNEVHRNLPPAP